MPINNKKASSFLERIKQRASRTLEKSNLERKVIKDGITNSEVIQENLKKQFGIDTSYEKAQISSEYDIEFSKEFDNIQNQALQIVKDEIMNGSIIPEFSDWKNAYNEYQRAKMGDMSIGVVEAESILEEAERKAVAKVIDDVKNNDLSQYVSLSSIELKKIQVMLSGLSGIANKIGIEDLYTASSNNQTSTFDHTYRDVAEIDLLRQKEIIRKNDSLQKLVDFNKKKR